MCLENLIWLILSPKQSEGVVEDMLLSCEVASGKWQTVEQGSSDSCCVMANYMLEEVRRVIWRQFPPDFFFFYQINYFGVNKPLVSAISQLKGFLVSALWQLAVSPASHSLSFLSFFTYILKRKKGKVTERQRIQACVCDVVPWKDISVEW